MLLVLSAALSVTVQGADLPTDRETLSGYMVQSCSYQQARDHGGTAANYDTFCTCLDDELSSQTSDTVYRAIALGSQGAIGENAVVDDPRAALEEAQRVMATVPPEEQQALAGSLQAGLSMCLPNMPGAPSGG